MKVKLDVTHNGQKTTVTVSVEDGFQGLRLMNAAEAAALVHAKANGWEVEHVDFLRVERPPLPTDEPPTA